MAQKRIAPKSVYSRKSAGTLAIFQGIGASGKHVARLRQKLHIRRNRYCCAVERNQAGKYVVRIRASFGRGGWTLPLYFVASSPAAAAKRLAGAVEILQREQECLAFWGFERNDDRAVAAELLADSGLCYDRRAEFPAKVVLIEIPWDGAVPKRLLAALRRYLAASASLRAAPPGGARPFSSLSRRPVSTAAAE